MSSLTRRSFLQKTTVATGATLAARFTPSTQAAATGANDAIRLGVIGLNGKGSAHLKNLVKMKDVRIAGLCDVDPEVLARTAKNLPQGQPAPFQTTDARELIARKDIDAVMIVTSNHWHALLTVWACQAGKDVYVEKPMSRTVWEGRKMIEAATKYNRIVQVGTHYRSETGLAEAIKYLHSGELGKVHHIRAIVYNLRLSIGRKLPWYPEGLNYDLFCGPTPMVPLTRGKLHYDWHWAWDTGNGELGNNGVHVLDIALRIAKHNGPPRRIMSCGGRYAIEDVAETPNSHLAVYDYPSIPLIFEHRALPAKPGVSYLDQVGGLRTGVIAYCEGGTVAGLIGATAFDKAGKQIKKFAGDGGATHVKNFFDAVRSRRKQDLAAPVETGHLSASLCHFGNISYRAGETSSVAKVDEAIGNFPAAVGIHRELQTHLGVHGIDLAKQPFRLGPWLTLDAIGDGITAVSSQKEGTLEYARFLLKETQRPPFVIPEVV
ncbi:MAG: Gfo/Idh/MocA family oxidoreductase [Verrucomicrobia bacterium]|nr:Gfo/Idh/MocA family oxidoreductase [Verrucomicrobiota bacterium]